MTLDVTKRPNKNPGISMLGDIFKENLVVSTKAKLYLKSKEF
jgi:hypothetical protein